MRRKLSVALAIFAAFVTGVNLGTYRQRHVLLQVDAALTKSNDALRQGIATMDALNAALEACRTGKPGPRQTVLW